MSVQDITDLLSRAGISEESSRYLETTTRENDVCNTALLFKCRILINFRQVYIKVGNSFHQ
jgi:hypothetical protein